MTPYRYEEGDECEHIHLYRLRHLVAGAIQE
jgi:hypothetical protein